MEETKLWIMCTETHYGNSSSIAMAESTMNSKSVPQGLLVEFFLGAIVFAIANLVFQRLQIRSSRLLPPGPSAWELLFQTVVLRRRTEVVLQNFAKRLGPVIHVRFWSQDMLVISSVAAAEEFYKLHDMEFGARPSSMDRSTSISNSVGALCFAPRAAHLKHISLILEMTGGTSSKAEPSTVGIEWALQVLRQHPKVMQHLREELMANLGMDHRVEETDIAELPYLQAVVKELFRLHPPSPFSFAHESSDDFYQLFGFEVQPRTQVFVNIYALQRDPVMWVNPNEFDPTRFVCRPEVNMGGQHYQLLPFGAGRRQCPGTKLSTTFVQLGLARFLQHVDSSA